MPSEPDHAAADGVVAAPETRVRQRTRTAILDSAVAVWARDITATQGEVADHAGVARSTLHRYYADRQSLFLAAYRHAHVQLDTAYRQTSRDGVSAAEEIADGIRASVLAGDAVIFLFADPNRFADIADPNPAEDGVPDPESVALVRRAQAEGAIDPDLEPSWVISSMYALIYTAAELVAQDHLPQHRAAAVAVRTLLRGVAP